MPGISADEFRAAMGSFATGVTIITTRDTAGKPFGLTATAFSSISREPPLCMICVSHAAEAHPALVASGRFAVNLLAAGQDALSNRFATSGLDKFDGVPHRAGTVTGCALLDGAIASIECTVQATLTAGDHDVLIGHIQSIAVTNEPPLVYFRGRYCDVLPR
ncbi:MAG TPA: flavin reductase family protein [Polyangiaceae bacterium]|nr:flavin reductase family protein [Polyangiaceae bacterium]